MLLAGSWLFSACLQSSQQAETVLAEAVATVPNTFAVGAWMVTLREAQVALGPVYFCAASSGSATLCETAAAELRNVTVVDALRSLPQPLGVVHALTGTVRSASLDFGLTWETTQTSATPAPSNVLGHSAQLEGEARRGDDVIPFTITVDLKAQYRGQRAVPTLAAEGVISAQTARLEVRINPAAWLSQLDFDRLPPNAPLTVTPTSPEHTALAVAMTSLAPPIFVWISP